ncbi:transcription factor bHLH94-like [Phalaenopsis equestris]|uniref:transcription factor bHLH94-like n=1 Tax=Phalaenopsis equestris TaxID=78828 RepID=UPI0009E44E06|nr:transcription factor bHLH94-like [Phalaenopsis equestris]
MALEAVVFHDLLSCNVKDMYSPWDIAGLVDEDKTLPFYDEWKASCSSLTGQGFQEPPDLGGATAISATAQKEDKAPATCSESNGRKKRRRTKGLTNKEEAENQRMTHIAVERNRRKQMNEYLAVLRSLMPASYAQRGDQASIVGGAINYVKELQQIVQFLEVRKQLKHRGDNRVQDLKPLASFFSFPQYSLTHTAATAAGGVDTVPANPSAVADIEVTIVESHASLKILCRRRPKQLLKLVVGLQSLRLSTLHLNATTFGAMVLFTFSLKVEEDCQLATVDEIATAVHQLVVRIHEEEGFYTSS